MALSTEVRAKYEAEIKHTRQQHSVCDLLPGQGTILRLLDYIDLLHQELDASSDEVWSMLELIEKQQDQLAEIRHPYCLSPNATARE